MLPDGKLIAQCVISAKRREGTNNQGASTGTEEVSESRRDRGLDQDKDDNVVAQIRGGVGGVVRNQLTGAPIPGATVRLNGFSRGDGRERPLQHPARRRAWPVPARDVGTTLLLPDPAGPGPVRRRPPR